MTCQKYCVPCLQRNACDWVPIFAVEAEVRLKSIKFETVKISKKYLAYRHLQREITYQDYRSSLGGFKPTTFGLEVQRAQSTAIEGHKVCLHSVCNVKTIYTFANKVEMFKKSNIRGYTIIPGGIRTHDLWIRNPKCYLLHDRDATFDITY
ncbi:hypothetical protein TNCV_32701 [Trichonephila clavipes]|nr:hypothetical protein TNCV_32701 [Trichonephila clavipes]